MTVGASPGQGRDATIGTDLPPFLPKLENRHDMFRGVNRWHRLTDGWLAAYDAGEFGAGIWWFAPDGSNWTWRLERIAALEQSPRVALAESGASALVFTERQLLRVMPGGLTVKLHDGHWASMGGTSIVVSGGRVYIGARHAVIRLDPLPQGGFKEVWLISPSCAHCDCPPE